MVSLLSCLVSLALGHPFESQFVGHKSEIQTSTDRLVLRLEVEVPLPLVERSFQESKQTDKKQWLSDWMLEMQSDITENVWLELNQERLTTWSGVEHQQPMWRESSKFLVFSTTFTQPLSANVEQILVLDQVLIGEPSVFWREVTLSRSVQVLDTDQIVFTDKGTYTTHLQRWEMEEQRREFRMVVDMNDIWQHCDTWWDVYILGEDRVQGLKQTVVPVDTWREWKTGKTPLWLGLMVLVGTWFLGRRMSSKHRWYLVIISILMSGLLLPVPYRFGILIFCGVGSLVPRLRLLCGGLAGCVILYPSWVLGLAMGYFLLFRSKNGNLN